MILKTPKTEYTDYYDRARFNLTWRINGFMFISLFILMVFYLFLDDLTVVPTLSGCLIFAVSFFVLKRLKKFEAVAGFWVVLGMLISILSLFTIKEGLHILDPLWMMVVSLYAFFALGKTWGVGILSIGFASYAWFLIFGLNENLTTVDKLELPERIALAINLVICGMILSYLLTQFIKAYAYAKRQLEGSNKKLTDQYDIISSQNKEKTAMLKEIHHRVKNNLQVITSLLRLQSYELKTDEAKETFKDAMNRIVAMSLIHEKMYQADNLGDIQIAGYFEALTSDLITAYENKTKIDLKIDANCEISSKTMVPLALIINELVANSLKHAFNDAETGRIEFTINSSSSNEFQLTYFDSGKWKTPSKESSFGLELIQTMTDQLEGHFSRREAEGGTKYHFTLKNLEE